MSVGAGAVGLWFVGGANANVTLTVDGADHTYRTSDSSSMHPAGYVAVAMD